MAKRRRNNKAANKNPQSAINPTRRKQPFAGAPSEQDNVAQISWRVSMMDLDGRWSFDGAITKRVLDKLAHFEKKTVDEWTSARGSQKVLKRIPVENLCAEAQKRLQQIRRDDVDELWEFHLNARQRIWCVRYESTMYLLWWDPDHQVCPSALRNT